MKQTEIRTRKLLASILDWDSDCCYYDDELETEVIDGTEDDLYDYVMKDDEMHLLGTEKVKAIIHTYFTDYKTFSAMCFAYKAH